MEEYNVLKNEHPDWKHEKVVALANSYNGLSKREDAIDLSNIMERSKSLSMSRFSTLVKAIKTRAGLKVGHAGILPQKTSLPMKNLNRLQTKMEKQVTEESKWLTAEQYEQRKQYAKYMRKADAELPNLTDEEYTDAYVDLYTEIVEYYPNLSPEEAIDRAFEPPQGDNAWIMSDEAEIISMNDGLNNIIKAPIILAKEMIQRYTTDKGELEYHFKPYSELKLAAELAKQNGPLDIIIEHQEWYDHENLMGSVKEIRADDSTKTIRGMGYFNESKLPDGLKLMIKNGEIIPVSIGFLAILGDGGTWNGVEYKHAQTNIILRHLAICLDSVPRCPAGICGVNLKDAENTNKKTFIIINKDSYYYNICDVVKEINLTDSKKETNKQNINLINTEKIETMQNDSDKLKKGEISQTEPEDLEAILKRLRILMHGTMEKENATARILAALGIKNKSDSEMDEKEFQDAIAKKDSEVEVLKKDFADAEAKIKVFEEKERLNYIKIIKKFGDKYSDEELEKKDLKSLEDTADAVTRFAPSEKKPDVLPKGNKTDKKKLEDDLDEGERIDPFSVYEDVNKEFNLSGL